MPDIIDDKVKQELKLLLANMKAPVRLLFFGQKSACPACAQQEQLLRELCALSGLLKLEVRDLVLDGDTAMNYKIDLAPATAVIGARDYGIRFYGFTGGHEFSSLLEAVLMISSGSSGLDPQLEALVRQIKQPVHLQVMVTLTCPYCPEMVHTAHQFAFLNDKIRADMVEAAEFPDLAKKHQVSGVPKTIINGTSSFEGALPAPAACLEIIKAVEPERYAAMMEAVRAARNAGKIKKTEAGRLYELVIVGGGPAAMSAAVYAARKGLDVALVAKKLGGQLGYTAGIDNYLGLAGLSGAEMTEAFRGHLERHQIAEAVGSPVTRIEKSGSQFLLSTAGGEKFKALCVIYCAGKEYKRLGAPGEERFMGKGIAFCATCDAPLYRGLRVAVVGGGNSAFTAVRDLLCFASEIHLVHRRPDFRADAGLVEQARKAPNVTLHTPMEVQEYLGTEKLTGIKLASPDGKQHLALAVDGVFLEIGLTPNSAPLQELIQLNPVGEIPVDRAQGTAEKGLFAAGDVTDTEEKQISIAVGQGALAALSAYKYLAENKLTRSTAGAREAWQ
ncbi:MAG TPA: FAD-dependent oxidoreductase [Elusimicrobiales bacterium]|nr:FAD-dependent oxidoreductase [Elusimicrobiales bacterium]